MRWFCRHCGAREAVAIVPAPAGHCPLDTGLGAAVHPSVCPAIPQSTTLPLSFLVSKRQQMNYKSDQILLQGEGVCV